MNDLDATLLTEKQKLNYYAANLRTICSVMAIKTFSNTYLLHILLKLKIFRHYFLFVS